MTEAEWMVCENAQQMLHSLRATASERKLRLFAVACCRRIEALFPLRFRAAINLSEARADGNVTDRELTRARAAIEDGEQIHRGPEHFLQLAALAVVRSMQLDWGDSASFYAAESCLIHTNSAESDFAAQIGGESAGRAKCASLDPVETALVRCVFGNPFRPVAFDPAWRTDTAVALARQMYDSRDFGAVPILADALQDAGCEDEAVLMHCRQPGPHARGCWVVDAVLGKG